MLANLRCAVAREDGQAIQAGIDGVRLSLLSLRASQADVDEYRRVLSPDERTRADRFVFDRDHRRFVVCRGQLRRLLGEAMGEAPDRVSFAYGAYGKPRLLAESELRFNVSHSDDWALIALTDRAEVGVDIERMKPLDDMDSLARQVFSPSEQERLQNVAAPFRIPAFYAGWTRKEAYVKARGDGLQRALDSFDVELTPGRPARLIDVRGERPGEADRWHLQALDIWPGYAAAVCVQRPGQKSCDDDV